MLASGAAVFREGQRRGGLCSAALCVGVGRGSWASSSRVARLRAARSVPCSGQCLGRLALGRRGWRWGSRWRRGDSALFFGTGCRDGFLVLALRWARTLSGGRGRALVLALVALSGSAAVSSPRQGWNKQSIAICVQVSPSADCCDGSLTGTGFARCAHTQIAEYVT